MSHHGEDRDEGAPRYTADRILLVVLLAINVATLIGVPIVGFSVYRILRRTPPGRYPAWFVPALFALLAVFELVLLLRFRALRRRLSGEFSPGDREGP